MKLKEEKTLCESAAGDWAFPFFSVSLFFARPCLSPSPIDRREELVVVVLHLGDLIKKN